MKERAAAETSMHVNARRVYTYQKQFEATQRAFLDAAVRFRELDAILSTKGITIPQPPPVELTNDDLDEDTDSEILW